MISASHYCTEIKSELIIVDFLKILAHLLMGCGINVLIWDIYVMRYLMELESSLVILK